jgi:hypothetical protein
VAPGQSAQSYPLLLLDLVAAKLLVWVASVGRDAELTPDAHLFFADRYQRLAAHHLRRGRLLKAERDQQRAIEHLDAGGFDGPPFAAAMAMHRPKQLIITNAVSRVSLPPNDDAA